MVNFEHKAGGYNQYMLIKYVSLWDASFKTAGVMRYMESQHIRYITDVSLENSGKEVRVYLYPHNKEANLEPIAEKHGGKLLQDILEIMESTGSKRKVYTFLFSTEEEPRLLEESDFSNFTPSSLDDDMFIFSTEADNGGFPNIFLIRDENKKGSNYTTLKIMTACSGEIVPSVNSITSAGKEFTYMLFNSYFQKKFDPVTPVVTSIDFPTRKEASFPRFLKTEALEKFASERVPDNLRLVDGKITYEEPKTQPEISKENEEEKDEEVFGLPPAQELENIVLDELINSRSINLSDAFQLGMGRTLAMTPFMDIIIPVNINMADTAKKMCIYEGQFHIIPLSDNFDAEDFFGEPADMFHVCTEETYPKFALPSGDEKDYIQ